ncbi:hypothetical protein M1555_05790 [Patescibacteria group bacterium]|nr:hypothetical protein [Patescibacteria group bacterium]
MELPNVVNSVIREFEGKRPLPKDGAHLTVSRTISVLAVLYEKVRNAVEFRAEHLIRRAAIERILKRRILLNGGSTTIAENLVIELLWARYIDSSLIDDLKIRDIQKIIERYLAVKHAVFDRGSKPKSVTWDDVLGVASSEIEETLVSPNKRDALNSLFYQAIRPKVTIAGRDETFVNVQTYVAVERSFAQSDDALISYHLMKLVDPGWFTAGPPVDATAVSAFMHAYTGVHQALHDPVGEGIYRFARRLTPAFLLIRDLFYDQGAEVRKTIEDPVVLEQKLAGLAAKKYQEIGTKVRRAVIRSFIYIFLTKMVFAFALEAPYDLYIAKKLLPIPLTINMLFPPILLILVAGFIRVPAGDNTKRLTERIQKILYRFDTLKDETDLYTGKKTERRPILMAVFTAIYILTFGATFYLIHLGLTALQFNIASQIIFFFFVALVTFFAYRIRQSAREYEIVEHQGVLEPVVDYLFLPILRAGNFLSAEIARLNVFLFVFDFILEAPLKVIFEVIEEWIRFVRLKKEEIV